MPTGEVRLIPQAPHVAVTVRLEDLVFEECAGARVERLWVVIFCPCIPDSLRTWYAVRCCCCDILRPILRLSKGSQFVAFR